MSALDLPRGGLRRAVNLRPSLLKSEEGAALSNSRVGAIRAQGSVAPAEADGVAKGGMPQRSGLIPPVLLPLGCLAMHTAARTSK